MECGSMSDDEFIESEETRKYNNVIPGPNPLTKKDFEWGWQKQYDKTPDGHFVPIASCDSVGKVHHYHKQRLVCCDTKTINEEDLPWIEKCCKCDKEQEIKSNDEKMISFRLTPEERAKAEEAIRKLRKQEQKAEFEGAKQTLAQYRAMKERRKKESK